MSDTKYFQLKGEITTSLLDNFINFYNTIEDQHYNIILDSIGGAFTIAVLIVKMINEKADKLTLISLGAYSSALYILYKSKCKKVLVEGSVGAYHRPMHSNITLTITGEAKYHEDVNHIKNFKSFNIDFVKEFMTKKELKKLNDNQDVFFTFKRMCKIFPDAEIIRQ